MKGQQFMEYVMEQWQLYHLEKEKEKQERVSAELHVSFCCTACQWLIDGALHTTGSLMVHCTPMVQ